MRVWAGYPDVDREVETIAKIFGKTGTLPELYLGSVKEIMAHSSKGLITRFYQQLAEKCPDALKLF